MKEVAEKKLVSVPARHGELGIAGSGSLGTASCTLFSVARSALSDQGHEAAKDVPVVARMKELCA